MRTLAVLATTSLLVACQGGEARRVIPAGGATTIDDRTSNAYSNPAGNLDADELERHLAGDVAFGAVFVTPPAIINPGLGPLYNHTACEACHVRDGRGLPQLGGAASQALVRVSLAEGEPADPGGPVPVPGLGLQLQDHAVHGQTPEVEIELAWHELPGRYGDGEPYSLRRPDLAIALADGAPLPADVLTSLRQAPPVFGLGLLEAVPADAVLALADPDDEDGDGISGRPNQVWNPVLGEMTLGRFGAKANTADLPIQTAAAFRNDMGVGNSMFVDDGGIDEIAAETLEGATFYVRTLAVPARALERDTSAGEALFDELGCAACHAPVLETGDHEVAALADQVFAPYTDLLLHDLGDGLADGRPDFAASGREWRTAPLWGIGLVQTVLPGGGLLHDGRARTLAEAILWHGGEAAAAAEAFRTAARADRQALLDFLGSL